DGVIRAPINGRVARVFVADGDTVADGDRLVVIEAMKMEHLVSATRAGEVSGFSVSQDQQVAERQVVCTIVSDDDGSAQD
ncbi:MAG: acetyl-CoA carboxylase biotin carboxyl carrier protein subunit, partial [Pseudomonadota bacterium]